MDFLLLDGQPEVRAQVLRWYPVKGNSASSEIEDIAVLELLPGEPRPPGIAPAPLAKTVSEDVSDLSVRMFGFPRGFDDGRYANGRIQGPMGRKWIEIHDESTGKPVEEGFSGAAVWDKEEKTVVGMIVAIPHKGAPISYMIPASTLVRSFPALARIDPEEIRSYCRKAEALYENLPFVGLKTRPRFTVRIEDIYVPLRAMVDLRDVGDACFADAQHAEKVVMERGCGKEISLPEAFHEMGRMNRRGIVMLGDPGAGKTTHLKRLLLRIVQGGAGKLNLPEDIVPVFLPLRELKHLDNSLVSFIQEQVDKPQLAAREGFGKRLLARGNLLFLLDGLDEVSELSHRVKVSRWIEEALRTYQTCRFVVTSRFAGYTPLARLDEQFIEIHVRPLTKEQAEEFVRNWYSIVERGSSTDEEQAETVAKERSDDLISRLSAPEFRARRVFELTRNPLLLTSLCLVHRGRGNLPRSRAILYEECTDVLLELWRGAVGLLPKMTAQSGKRVLQSAALWLHQEENRTRAKASELAPVIEPALKSIGWRDGTAEDFLRAVRDESGLLTGWDQERYGFMHLGFQEYLAAREIQNRVLDEPGVLRDLAARFGDPWWQEVTLLMLSLENPPLFEPFMWEVVKGPAFATQSNLLQMCLDDTAKISPVPFLGLLEKSAGNDPGLWERQLTAFMLLERMGEGIPDPFLRTLANHPFDKIRKRVEQRWMLDSQELTGFGRAGEMVRIPGGNFLMGSLRSEKDPFAHALPAHRVTMPDFYMGRYPVTNAEYGAFLSENPETKEPEFWGDRRFNQPSQPVFGVSWEEARRYAQRAGVRLPTEAEWEYACRAGTTTPYYTGEDEEDLDRAGWYRKNSGDRLHPVGEKEPNAFGLYDMHGNVEEWVEDDWHRSYHGAPDDGSAWVDEPRCSSRVVRGGAWDGYALLCRSAFRNGTHPGNRTGPLGFRLARSLP